MKFKEIFKKFLEHEPHLKVIFVGSADMNGSPNCAPKMLIDVVAPNKIFYMDYKSLKTYKNILENFELSVSFMDDRTFTGFRLSGSCHEIASGPEFESVRAKWNQKVVAYEAQRMAERIRGNFSTRKSEATLPDSFVVIKFVAEQGSLVKPDRVLRAMRSKEG